jgi:SnoaL-like domain
MIRFLTTSILIILVASAFSSYAQQADTAALSETIVMYCAAWSESDVPKRTQMLKKTWATQGTYTDPTAQVEGREALIVHIGKFLEQYPGAQIVVSSAIDAHHERFRFGWKMLAADGSTALEGMDFGEVDEKGQIRRITGFFGPLGPRQ